MMVIKFNHDSWQIRRYYVHVFFLFFFGVVDWNHRLLKRSAGCWLFCLLFQSRCLATFSRGHLDPICTGCRWVAVMITDRLLPVVRCLLFAKNIQKVVFVGAASFLHEDSVYFPTKSNMSPKIRNYFSREYIFHHLPTIDFQGTFLRFQRRNK